MIINNWEIELKSGKTKTVSINISEEGGHEHDTTAMIDAAKQKADIFEGYDAAIVNNVNSTIRLKDSVFNVQEIAAISCSTKEVRE